MGGKKEEEKSQRVTLMESLQHTTEQVVVPIPRCLSLPHLYLSQDRPIKMSSTPKVRPQMVIKETLGKTKKLLHRTFKNLKKSLIFAKYQEQPTNPSPNPTCPDDHKASSILQKMDKWDAFEVKKTKKEVPISHVTARSISFAGCRGLEGLKEDKNGRKHSGAKKTKGSSFRGAESLARKMKDLEMMNASDMDHVLDVEEVLHYYSRLSCPTYMEIVENFFKDMDSELKKPHPSRSGSMRKVGPASGHGSMRSLGALKL